MRTLRYVLVDVFTDQPLTGNQLAVFTDARNIDGATMQALAREMNYSESTFVLPATSGGHARIRIFTPVQEIPFAGHPTLGTAFVLAAPLQTPTIQLETGAGTIPVRFELEGSRLAFAWMTQPVPSVAPFLAPDELLAALGVDRSGLPVELYDNGITHVLVDIGSKQAVATLRPDLGRLARLPVLGVITFAGSGATYKTRMFAPASGINEDPATGSAAGPLAVHLTRHGRLLPGETIVIEQGAEIGRPSRLYARVEGAPERIDRVEVGGQAVLVARGEFKLP